MEKMSRSGQDLTIAIVITVILFLGAAAAFYQYVYTVKEDEIASLEAQERARQNTFNSYRDVIVEKLNYEDKLAVLHKTWDDHKHYFVNGLVNWNDRNEVRQTQFTIFHLYEKVINSATFSGIEVQSPVSQPFRIVFDMENLRFHPDDHPFDFPPDFIHFYDSWEFVPSERFPDDDSQIGGDVGAGSQPSSPTGAGFGTGGGGARGAVGTAESKSLFTAHNFTIEFEATFEQLKRFINVLQDLEGEETWIISIHCFEVTDDPIRFGFPATLRGDMVITDVKVPMSMFCTAYELFEPGPTNQPPNLPGETACGASGGGGRSGGGSGGMTGGAGMGS